MRWNGIIFFLIILLLLSFMSGCMKQKTSSAPIVHLVGRCRKYIPGGDFREFSGICDGPSQCQNFCASWCRFENYTSLVGYDHYKNATDHYLYCDCACQ